MISCVNPVSPGVVTGNENFLYISGVNDVPRVYLSIVSQSGWLSVYRNGVVISFFLKKKKGDFSSSPQLQGWFESSFFLML